ncbi:hypothetical protein B0H15DRAFT_113733 [Mycena belliarum]|uniref:Uncharacterized protein n=1 Tax=Mycena belliarum TaxID=1033014 RepID=A0AAD6UG38_9AGAR|nr:hypothetical protein B0H15DRAFT_113733 [Mycena belliae]
MPTYESPFEPLVFPYRQNMRLFISVSKVSEAGKQVMSRNTMAPADVSSLDAALRAAQQEIVEQEIFSLLVKEAGNLPTASARVSERLIVIDAAQGVELKFELVRVLLFPRTCRLPYTAGRRLASLSVAHGLARKVRLYLLCAPGAPPPHAWLREAPAAGNRGHLPRPQRRRDFPVAAPSPAGHRPPAVRGLLRTPQGGDSRHARRVDRCRYPGDAPV